MFVKYTDKHEVFLTSIYKKTAVYRVKQKNESVFVLGTVQDYNLFIGGVNRAKFYKCINGGEVAGGWKISWISTIHKKRQ